ncbi:MAG: N4-gp56 family major capsid protein [Clostridia bacterium]|nr:N4-gp56 family major capsid protein [Clostridia bacterium]
MANQITKVSDVINPEVMADIISAKVTKKIAVAPFAKVDTTLAACAGDTIKVPRYTYIGDAEDVAEGEMCETSKLTATTTSATVKKAMKAVSLTDEVILSGYGNPVGEAVNQISLAIASKVDNDALDALLTAETVYDESSTKISYSGIVSAIDLFSEEVNSEKVIFVHPSQVTQLRKDADFISADKYVGGVMLTGEIGMIANCRVVPSKKIEKDETGAFYINPIIKLTADTESEDETPALTIYLKRDTMVETERDTLKRTTNISADKHYTVALSDTSKVVLAKFKA